MRLQESFSNSRNLGRTAIWGQGSELLPLNCISESCWLLWLDFFNQLDWNPMAKSNCKGGNKSMYSFKRNGLNSEEKQCCRRNGIHTLLCKLYTPLLKSQWYLHAHKILTMNNDLLEMLYLICGGLVLCAWETVSVKVSAPAIIIYHI